MAEITQDIYSVKGDFSQFDKELSSVISRIEELEQTLNDATASSEELAEAQEGLVSANKDLDKVLSTQAKTVDDLDSKQTALTKQQDSLNKSSTTYTKVANENTKVQKQQAQTVAASTKNNKTFGKSLISNVRNFNRVRGAARALNTAFRALAGVSVFGLALQALPAILELLRPTRKEIRGLSQETQDLNRITESIGQSFNEERAELDNLFGALNNTNLSTQERSAVISQIQSQYGEYIGNINLETASQDELKTAYDAASAAILSQVVAKAKAARARELINNIIEREIRLQNELRSLEDGAAAVLEQNAGAVTQYNQAIEQLNPAQRQQVKTFQEQQEALQDLTKVFAQSDVSNAKRDIEELDEVFAKVEKRLQEELIGLLDPATLYGEFSPKTKEAASTVSVLEGSLADLQKELSKLQKLQKEQTETTDVQALASLQKQIDLQQQRIDEAKKILADLRGVAEAEANIERLRTEATETETDKRIRLIEERSRKEIDALVGTETQKAEQEKLIVERTRKEVNEITEAAFQDSLKKAEEEAERFRQIQQQGANEDEAILVANQQRLLSIRLRGLEQQRQTELSNEELTNEQLIELSKSFDAQRVEAEQDTQREILKIQIEAQEKRVEELRKFGDSTIEAERQLEQLRLELLELDRVQIEPEVKVDTDEASSKLKELFTEITDGLGEVADSIFGLVAQQASFLTENLDRAVNRSQSALDNIRQNSEDFNADQLEIEKQRLAQLEQARLRAAQREQRIAQIQIATNSVIAIARAAAEGGIAAPFTIAATLASLIAGFAAARNASTAAFYEGTEYLNRGGAPKGRDTIHIRAHEGERIIPTSNNLKYWDSYSALQNEKIPSDVAGLFTNGYLKGGIKGAVDSLQGVKRMSLGGQVSLIEKVGSTNYYMNNTLDLSSLEKRLDSLEVTMRDLPKYMPTSNFKADSKGFTTYITKRQRKAEMRRNRAK